MSAVKAPSKNVIRLGSKMHIEGYSAVKLRCVCCRAWHKPDGELRLEDIAELEKLDSPVCSHCSKFLKKWDKKLGRLELMLRDYYCEYFPAPCAASNRTSCVGCAARHRRKISFLSKGAPKEQRKE